MTPFDPYSIPFPQPPPPVEDGALPNPQEMERQLNPEGPADPNNENLPEELQAELYELVKQYEEEDSWVRKQQIKLWKKNEEFWHGVQYIFWSETKQDWVAPTETRWFAQEEGREEAEGPFYDYVINIYKAHGEAIIAALGAQVPVVRFPPDDAENQEDLITSKTFSKIGDLICRHNQAKILILRALFTLCNQGVVCAYHAPKSDKAFGEVEIPEYDLNEEGEPIVTGTSKRPKSRTVIELYGPLNVKVPFNIEKQEEAGYLMCKKDHALAFLKYLYPHVKDKIENDQTDVEHYERTARTPSSFSSWDRIDENQNLRTLNRVWFRPWIFDGMSDTKAAERDALKKLFPNGCYCAFIGKTYVESRDEELDKYWTVGQCGLSRGIHSDPILQPLIPVQEMTNVLANLTLETIEQGIPSTFADTDTLNFNAYSRHEARPGMVYPMKVKAGTRASDKFYEQGRATLSKEVQVFGQALEKAGQFVVGAFPSVYGGPSEGSSRTAAEYNMSRQMALQRLGIVWSFLTAWWANVIEKSVRIFVDSMTQDERYVIPGEGKGDTNYINVWIRRSEMTGKVGEVEPEGAESFPASTPQKQELLMRLLQMNNAFLNQAIFDPENLHLLADTLAYPDVFIPGEDQRIKQSREIQELLKGNMIMPEPEVDDDAIHITTIKNWAVGSTGLDAKMTNPQGYQAVIQHLSEHLMILQQKMGSMPPQNPEMGNNPQPQHGTLAPRGGLSQPGAPKAPPSVGGTQ